MLGKIIAVVVALPLGYLGLMMGASELAEEVVALQTMDEHGRGQLTSLWIVEDELGTSWLRAGQSESGWLERIRADPAVEVERDGRLLKYNAVPVPDQRERIHRLMRERYGWSDRIISALRDGSGSIPVRLDER